MHTTHYDRFEIWGFRDKDGDASDRGSLLLESEYDATANAVQVCKTSLVVDLI